jgi:hypothetical protein
VTVFLHTREQKGTFRSIVRSSATLSVISSVISWDLRMNGALLPGGVSSGEASWYQVTFPVAIQRATI